MPTSMLLGVGAPGGGGGGPVPSNITPPVASGSTVQGSTLSTTNGTWTASPTSYNYHWQTSPDGVTSWTNISLATSSTYVTVSGDVGNFIRSTVQAVNANGNSAFVASNALGPITASGSSLALPGMMLDVLLLW